MTKTEFPALLAALLERAKPGQHMAAAFRTCGLFPVDKNEVIKDLPSCHQTDATASRQLLDETFGERLKSLRGVDQPKQKRGKKVAPGKCYTDVTSSSEEEADDPLPMEDSEIEDNSEMEMEEDSQVEMAANSDEEVVRPTGKRIRGSVESSSESELEADPEDGPSRVTGTGDSGKKFKGKGVPGSTSVKCKNVRQEEEFPVGGFVVAMYEGFWYIGQVEGEDPEEEVNGFTLVQYMERKGENRFTWSKKDLLKTLNTDILLRIESPIPVTNRGFMGLPQTTLKQVEKLVKEWSRLNLRLFETCLSLCQLCSYFKTNFSQLRFLKQSCYFLFKKLSGLSVLQCGILE